MRVRYLHSDIKTMERMELIRDLRLGEYQVLVGINLLREGLDIPEVSLVAVLDADKEGFLRSARSLIQTCGRAARNVKGMVILYGDRITDSMRQTMDETERRRAIQAEYNTAHGITPESVQSRIKDLMDTVYEKDYVTVGLETGEAGRQYATLAELRREMKTLEKEMLAAAKELAFEDAAALRDQLKKLKEMELAWL